MSNVKIQMTNQAQNLNDKKYDLEERTAKFGEAIIKFAQSLPQNPINNSLIGQVVRAGTSIGANYMEADAAESKKDFRHKISLCRKESKETKHWLRMIAKANPTKIRRKSSTMERSSGANPYFFLNTSPKEERLNFVIWSFGFHL